MASDQWADALQACKLGGLELPVSKIARAGGFAFARQRYPFRPGQETEDTGREPQTFALTVPLYAGMVFEGGEELFPARYEELLFLLTDSSQAGEVEYVDPVLGPYQVKIASWNADDDATMRNGGLFQIQLEENVAVDEALRFSLGSERGNTFSKTSELAEEVDASLEDLGITDEQLDQAFADSGYPLEGDEREWPSGERFASSVADAFTTFNSAAANVDDVVATSHRFAARAKSVASSLLESRETWSERASLVRLRGVFESAARRVVQNDSRKISQLVTSGTTNVYAVATALYGHSRFAEQLLELNSLSNPMLIPAGTVLRVWVAT